MLKKTSSSTYSGLQCCVCSHSTTSSTSPFALPPYRARSHGNKKPLLRRTYANVRGSKEPVFRDNMNWPCRKASNASPTPYEIFELEKGGLYSKHKFYELVKIYHPDRNGHADTVCEGITHIERLERYRLVVQAHEILSDPVKRRAYDSYGAGWGENARNITRHSRGFTSSANGKTYGFGPDNDSSIFGNATWEDWERWYRRSEEKDKQAYTGTYINPNAFASFVILIAVISGVAQATSAGKYSGSLEERAKAFTEETNRFLASRAEQYNGTSDGRIKHFLEKRDPTRYGLKDEEEEHYRRHFAGQHIAPLKPSPKLDSSD
jgi:curved DNA-binding protein CbpA